MDGRDSLTATMAHSDALVEEASEHLDREHFEAARARASKACALYARCLAEVRESARQGALPAAKTAAPAAHPCEAAADARLEVALDFTNSIVTAEFAHLEEQVLRLRGWRLDGLDQGDLLALKIQLERALELVTCAYAEADTSMPRELEELPAQ